MRTCCTTVAVFTYTNSKSLHPLLCYERSTIWMTVCPFKWLSTSMVKAACWGARNYIAPERIRMRQIIWELLLYQLYCMNYAVPIIVWITLWCTISVSIWYITGTWTTPAAWPTTDTVLSLCILIVGVNREATAHQNSDSQNRKT